MDEIPHDLAVELTTKYRVLRKFMCLKVLQQKDNRKRNKKWRINIHNFIL